MTDCGSINDEGQSGNVWPNRTYYIAVNEEIWDYSPTGQDVMHQDLSTFINQEKGKFIGEHIGLVLQIALKGIGLLTDCWEGSLFSCAPMSG